MPQINIDGTIITTEPNKTIIQAAFENNIYIPHFCWHPELSIAGNCRMCLVETGMPKKLPDGSIQLDENNNPVIQWMPKLQIACDTIISDGMYVRTQGHKTIQAQEAVMEFLLINHPLDCPICDEAGECKLQEYAYKYSEGESRFIEEKNHKPKHIKWGPNVIYDGERCISCSRCIRYAKEIAKQDVLTFINRGDRVQIKLFDDTKFDNPYSMNVIELCPVGALTSLDFRFKSRVWEMSFNDSICPGCARGCNMQIGVRNNQILRLQPRTNMHVNRYWMCDAGRLEQYPFVNEGRIINSFALQNNEHIEISFEEAKHRVVEKLSHYKPNEIMVFGSAYSPVEDNYILQKFANQILKTNNLKYLPHIDENFGDNFLRVKDRTPNAKGCEEVGIQSADNDFINSLISNIKNKNVKAMLIMNDNLDRYPQLLDVLGDIEFLIVLATNHNKLTAMADIVIACSTYAESEGTYINIDGRVQHFKPAIVTNENRAKMGQKMSRWDKFGSHNDKWTQHETRNCNPGWKIIRDISNSMGMAMSYKKTEDVFTEISQHISNFRDMNYHSLDNYEGIKLGGAKNPEPVGINYVSHFMKPD
ncbi:MAG TPA: 2Fe-2S iron-sulfur cluster-binding protein [Candidatus Kapabacteria bacterium]|nr:(2Fe-2S)-binding protein [Candidatus Kapabacteria bacterium]HOV92537.1 2Fe-2S iron-sulfur cluster-binding protein [Candidatus Kapabacteria bacterium]